MEFFQNVYLRYDYFDEYLLRVPIYRNAFINKYFHSLITRLID
jgi:hypothetical protein